MAKKPLRRSPKVSLGSGIRDSIADVKNTSWLERLVILLVILLTAQIVYYVVFVPGEADLELRLAEKKVALASEKIVTDKPKTEEETKSDTQNILAAIDKIESERNKFQYDPAGKRDPFLPFGMSAKIEEDTAKTPLERYDLGQLKLTAILAGMGEPKAIVENAAGKGFTVTIGTKIGRNNGTIVSIDAEKVVVRERFVNFTGEEQVKDVDLRLRVKGLDDDGQISIR